MDPTPSRAARAGDRTLHAAADGIVPESVFGADDRIRVGDTSVFPWTAIGQITVFAPGVTALGTGVLIGPNHMLTAGHVAFNDAFGADGKADAMTVRFGLGGSPELDISASMVEVRALPGWIDSRLAGEDLALVTLDRSIGAATGVFDTFSIGMESFFDGLNVNIAGFPGDREGGQALFLATGPIDHGTADRLFYKGTLDTAGGMSGAPIWQFLPSTGARQLLGIHTTGVVDPTAPGAFNGATRLTAERLDLIDEWVDQDAILNPPDDRPDLLTLEPFFAQEAAGISPGSAAPGAQITVRFHLRNMGTAPSPEAEVRFFLSLNDRITEFDIPLGAAQAGALAPLASVEVSLTAAVPLSMPEGAFHVGWIIDPDDAVPEFDEANNTGLLGQTLTVGGALPNLVIRDFSVERTDWHVGDSVGALWSVANAGAAASAAAGSALFLSPDAAIGPDDMLLAAAPGAALAPEGAAPLGAALGVEVPFGLAPGSYFVGAIADPENAVAESDETDNAGPPLAVTVLNRAPVAADDSAGTQGQDPVEIAVLDNDSDPDGHALALSSVGPAQHGIVAIAGNAVRYTPAPGFAGVETLGYRVTDAFGATADGVLTISVAAVPVPGGGTEGEDRLIGGAGAESIAGAGGDDLIDGGGGGDTLSGGAGADLVFGGGGDDLVHGDQGRDRLFGGRGDDSLEGGEGEDLLSGQEGDDSLSGAGEADFLIGGAGADSLDGGAEDDRLLGEGDGDLLTGGAGDDLLFGQEGDDSLFGDAGDDALDGGAGADLLQGGRGADALIGGSGADRFVFAPGDGADRIADFAPGEDRLVFVGLAGAGDLSLGSDGLGNAVIGYGVDLVDRLTVEGVAAEALATLDDIDFV